MLTYLLIINIVTDSIDEKVSEKTWNGYAFFSFLLFSDAVYLIQCKSGYLKHNSVIYLFGAVVLLARVVSLAFTMY